MAVHYYRKLFDREAIKTDFYPFASPQMIGGLLVGNDLDSLLSAVFLKTIFNWNIVGFYDYERLWYSADIHNFKTNLLAGRYLAADLDIYHPSIPSIGHHVLEIMDWENLPGHQLSLNPNLIRGISLQNFRHKYPLAMIHFLLWCFDTEVDNSLARMLIWLADSAYINAQSHRFRDNVADWLWNFIPTVTMLDNFEKIDSVEYEQALQNNLLPHLNPISICRPSGQVKSHHLGMTGYQCQWTDPEQDYSDIKTLIDLISRFTGWQPVEIPIHYHKIEGKKYRLHIGDILNKDSRLAEFLKKQAVFSYVFPFSKVICITRFESQDWN